MDIIQWLNEFSDEDDVDSSVDDDFNDPDFEMPDLQNSNVDTYSDENEDNEPVSEEDNIYQSNSTQNNLNLDSNQLNWGPVTGNLNDIPYNPCCWYSTC
jgi:hypothetical protein